MLNLSNKKILPFYKYDKYTEIKFIVGEFSM